MPPFEKGNTLSTGRPRGSRNKVHAEIDAIAHQSLEQAVKEIGRRAADGETDAARLLFARVWPRAQGRRIEIDLPPLEKPADLVSAYSALLAAIARGEISPEQGAKIGEVLERKRLALETIDLEDRLTALEVKTGLKPAD
ncbi:MAG TPA: hypothetical protein VMI56_04220 [Reyranella sp.]|nr:hypothetical protein [Reyranella sp.]